MGTRGQPAFDSREHERTGARAPANGGSHRLLPWLRERLLPRDADAMMLVAYAMILIALILFIVQPPPLPLWRFFGTIIALSLHLILNLTLPDIERGLGHARALRLFYGASAALVILANGLGLAGGFFTFLPFLIFLLAGQAFSDLPARVAALYVAGVVAGWLGMLSLRGSSADEVMQSGLQISLGLVFTICFGVVLRRYGEQFARAERLLRDLQVANDELRAAREREHDLATAEERVRLAREIHDGLGHHLTVLNVQLQAAAKLLERDPERAQAVINLCREEAQAALLEARRSVAAMRRTPLDGGSLDEALVALVHDFDRHAQLDATCEIQGESVALSPHAGMTLYRAAQEGLTNAQKHAAARSVHVVLCYDADAVRLTVRDDGRGPAMGDHGGFGLPGLRERAEQLGGTFRAGPGADGGFELAVSLPLLAPDDSSARAES